MIRTALDKCTDSKLYVAMNLSFACSLRMGEILGLYLPENFRQPFFSASVKELWARWHISLSQWFRDYVYIPLGGNRKGRGRQLLAIAVVWLATGLWHGAAWTFVLWGLWFCLLLLLSLIHI